ncbi:hypothetical protein [Mucilaginibacter agri]|uniref:Outer membrane lipoprotein carrier protein LolA n=1 Tax=Mucilaginibacter agri TaxID=2695265 RepID=A0A965ZKA4_9SPHI|nr:hypothetical protein [Mucilaginibacter agri]NCD71489.1 hypothetical protein [Mucilaginibacter agri]
MKALLRQFKLIYAIACLMVFTGSVHGQTRYSQVDKQLKEFNRIANEANIVFTLPEGFKEITPISNEDVTYDYGIAMPGHDVEVWFEVKSYKQVSKYYANADSAYISMAKEQVSVFSADNAYFTRNLNDNILAQYNADAGKSYLVNLSDSPVTRHYKYALIITIQKDHTGTILAVCLTNDKGPDFFKDIDKARNCIRFK